MKHEVRRDLAQLSFEEKIHKVAELIRLSRNVKLQRIREESCAHQRAAKWNKKGVNRAAGMERHRGRRVGAAVESIPGRDSFAQKLPRPRTSAQCSVHTSAARGLQRT